MLDAHVLAQAVATSEWSPIPILSFGAFFSICTAAVGYGVVKAKTDSSSKAVSELRQEMKQGLEDINRELRNINRQLGRVEGAQERGRDGRRSEE